MASVTAKPTVKVTYQQLRAALLEAERCWGSTDTGKAKPQAVQLEDRVKAGRRCQSRQFVYDPETAAKIGRLEERLAKARAEPGDQRRCRDWEAAHRRFETLNAQYLEQERAEHDQETVYSTAIDRDPRPTCDD